MACPGVATGLIHLSNALETWDSKISILLHGGNPLPDQDWLHFFQMLDEWGVNVDNSMAAIGSTQKEDEKDMEHTQWVASSKGGMWRGEVNYRCTNLRCENWPRIVEIELKLNCTGKLHN